MADEVWGWTQLNRRLHLSPESFPHTSLSPHLGLIGVTGVTGVKSRFVCAMGDAILVLLRMVATNGIKVLSRVDFVKNLNNLLMRQHAAMISYPSLLGSSSFGKFEHGLW